MLETCFMVAATALVPILLSHFGFDSAVIWRIASAIFLCIAIPFEFIARNRTRDIPNLALTKINVNTINWSLSISADLILVAVLLGVVGTKSEALYLVALFVQLALAGNLFVQFAGETFTRSDQD